MNSNTRACIAYITGLLHGRTASSVYDYGNGAHIQLNMNGSQFSGYDYDSGNHYSGTVNGSSVSIYDYETSQHYSYSV